MLLGLVSDHAAHRLLASEDHDTAPCPCHRRVEEIPRHQKTRAGEQRQNHGRVLAALGLVDRHGISELQLLQRPVGILDKASFVKFDLQALTRIADGTDHTHISVEYAVPAVRPHAVPAADLPAQLIIVLRLHDLVAHPEQMIAEDFFRLPFGRRIKIALQDSVQAFDAQRSLAHRAEHLNIIRLRVNIGRKLPADKLDDAADDPVHIAAAEKKEVAAPVVKRDLLAPVDPVGVDDDIRAFRLTENPVQPHAGKGLRGDDVLQHRARTHGRKLVHIAHEDQPRTDRHGGQQGMHQKDIHHRHLVDDNDVRLERIRLIAVKGHAFRRILRRRSHLQHPVNRRRLVPGSLRHALRRASCGRRQQDGSPFSPKVADQLVDRGRLAGTRPAGQHQHAVHRCADHRLPLALVQHDPAVLFQRVHILLRRLPGDAGRLAEIQQHPRAAELQMIIAPRVDDWLPVILLPHDLPLEAEPGEFMPHLLSVHTEEGHGAAHQLFLGEVHAAFSGSRGQHVEKTAPDPVTGSRVDPDLPGQPVCRQESDSVDILRETVRVGPEDFIHILPVGLVDPDAHPE